MAKALCLSLTLIVFRHFSASFTVFYCHALCFSVLSSSFSAAPDCCSRCYSSAALFCVWFCFHKSRILPHPFEVTIKDKKISWSKPRIQKKQSLKKSVDQDQVGEQSESGGKEAKGTPGVLDPSPTRMVAALAWPLCWYHHYYFWSTAISTWMAIAPAQRPLRCHLLDIIDQHVASAVHCLPFK